MTDTSGASASVAVDATGVSGSPHGEHGAVAPGTPPLRVLLYTPYFSPSVGGMETFAARLADGLREIGVDVVLTTDTAAGDGGPAPDVRKDPLPVVRRPDRRRQVELVRWADVVHLSGFDLPFFLLAKAFRKPLVWTHHDYNPVCTRPGPNGERPDCGPLHLRVCWPELYRTASLRDAIKSYARQWVHLAARHAVDANVVIWESHPRALGLRRYQVIPYWVDLPAERDAERPALGPPADVVFASRHVGATGGKGGDVLLRALARLQPESRDWRVVLAGDGPARPEWMELARRLGVSAEFPGAVSWEVTSELLRQARVTVMPTVYAEYFGLTALEAMVQGTYVAASASGGLGEFVGRCGGATFPPGDDVALATILRDVMSDGRRAIALGEGMRDRASRRFSRAASIAAYVQLYQAVRRPRLRGVARERRPRGARSAPQAR